MQYFIISILCRKEVEANLIIESYRLASKCQIISYFFQVIALDDDFIVDSDDNMGESTDNLGTTNDNLGSTNYNLGDNNDNKDNNDNNLEDDIDPNDLCDQSINDPRLVCEVGLGEES